MEMVRPGRGLGGLPWIINDPPGQEREAPSRSLAGALFPVLRNLLGLRVKAKSL